MLDKPFSFHSKVIWAFTVALVFLMSLSFPAWAASTKGIQVVVKDRQGKEVGLYKGSYALLIGASRYKGGWPSLTSVPHEMKTVKEVLEKAGFVVELAPDPDAKELRRAIESFINRYGYDPENRLLFFFSGHGYTRKQGKKGYLVPVDAPDPRENEHAFLQKALPMTWVMAWSRQIEAKHVLFLFDSCFSGTIFKSKDLPKVPPDISDKTARPVRQFISAGDADEPVPAASVFTPSFVRAVEGEADLDKDGYVTGTELGMYLHKQVLHYRTGQKPQYGKIRDPDLDQGDFVFQVASSGAVVDRPGASQTTLAVSCNVDGARVYVDGRQLGTTPLSDATVSSGDRTIRVEKPGYDPYQKRIRIDACRAVSLYVDLRPAGPRKARLFVETEPSEAAIRILNISPRFYQGMELEPGRYEVEVSAERHESWKEWVDLGAGEDKNLMVRLETVPVPSAGTGGSVKIFTVNGISFKMVRVTAGEFMMGSPANEPNRDNDETQHRVRISRDFWMGQTEVTQRLWKAVMGSNPSHFSNCGDDCPVESVSWNDCQDFIRKLNGMVSGGNFRLPTEAEWEYACRAGTTGPYAGDLDAIGWYGKNSGGKTHGVGQKKPNAWGLYDMHGNVWEWCQDWYGDYPAGSVTDPSGPSAGSYRVLRGGGWDRSAGVCRSANRYGDVPGIRYFYYGFRLAALP